MGTIPIEENVKISCSDGRAVFLSVDTTTSDLSMGDDGTAGIYGRFDDGRTFGFSVPLSIYDERWFRRLCDAVAANPEFRDSLVALEEVDDRFTIPSAPSRDGGAVARLARMGGKAKFRDFAALRSGRDRFSAMKLPDLETAAGDAAVAETRRKMGSVPQADRDGEVAKVLRWVLRGLPVAMAVRKVEVDREVSVNAEKSGRRR